MAFIRWNELTHIWEVATSPLNKTTSWNHLPIGTPTLPGDTVNKAYVDGLIGGGGFVPYVGATANVNLGAFNLFATKIGVSNTNPQALLHVGPGVSAPILSSFDGLFVNINTVAQIAIRNSFNAVEGGMFAHVSQLFIGTWTNHQLTFRVNNIDVGIFIAGGSFFIAGSLFERGRGVAVGDWQAWTPTWKSYSSADGVIGNGSLVGRYTIVGKTVFYTIQFLAGTTTVFPASYWAFTLPLTAAGIDLGGTVTMAKVSVGYANGLVVPAAYHFGFGSSIGMVSSNLTSMTETFISSGYPWTWAAGDRMWISGQYEMA